MTQLFEMVSSRNYSVLLSWSDFSWVCSPTLHHWPTNTGKAEQLWSVCCWRLFSLLLRITATSYLVNYYQYIINFKDYILTLILGLSGTPAFQLTLLPLVHFLPLISNWKIFLAWELACICMRLCPRIVRIRFTVSSSILILQAVL